MVNRISKGGWQRVSDFTIVDSGVINMSVPLNSTMEIAQYEHGLGYEPAFLAYGLGSLDEVNMLPNVTFYTSGGNVGKIISNTWCSADTQYFNVYFERPNQGDPLPATLIDVRFYLLNERGTKD